MYKFPASAVQRDIWDSVDGTSSDNNVSLVLEISGPLDRGALRTALDRLSARHESLRTAFTTTANGLLLQQIPSTLSIDPFIVDLRTSSNPDTTLRAVLQRQLTEPFQLTAPPLWRTALILLPANRILLAVTLHHIISDRWSLEVFRQDLAHLYDSGISGRPSSLPDLEIQYVEYTQWERERPASRLNYWRRKLSSLPAPPRLPVLGTWQPGTPCTIAARPIPALSLADTADLCVIAGSSATTLAQVLHAATVAVLTPYFGDRLVLGVVYANRDESEFRPLIGPFVDHLPLPIPVTDETTFADLVSHVTDEFSEAHSRRMALRDITTALPTQPSPNRSLFDVQVNYFPDTLVENYRPAITESKVTFNASSEVSTDNFEIHADRESPLAARLGFVLRDAAGGGIEGAVFANADAFGIDGIVAMGKRFNSALSLLAHHPRRPVRSLILELDF